MMQCERCRKFRANSQTCSSCRGAQIRRGFTIVELIVAGIIISVVMTVSLQMLAGLNQQQRLATRRQLAADELANLMERATNRPFKDLTNESLQSLNISDAARERLPDSELKLSVVEQPGPPVGKQIAAEIRWRDTAGAFSAPVRLVAWQFADSGGQP